jgi:hypothetical protein
VGGEGAAPPAVVDATRDELHLRVGGIAHEPLAQIDDETVFAGALHFSRAEVAWVHLAEEDGKEREPAAGTERPRGEPEEGAAFRGCPDEAPLGAWIWIRHDFQNAQPPACGGTETHVFRFVLEPAPGSVMPGEVVALVYSAKEFHYEAQTDGCFDHPESDPYEDCSGPAAHVEGTVAIEPASLAFAKFFPMLPSLAVQHPDGPPIRIPVTCQHRPTGSTSETEAAGLDTVEIEGKAECNPDRRCDQYCVAPGYCAPPNQADSECSSRLERHAAIPFEGSIVDPPGRERRGLCLATGGSEVRWHVCCGCAEQAPTL